MDIWRMLVICCWQKYHNWYYWNVTTQFYFYTFFLLSFIIIMWLIIVPQIIIKCYCLVASLMIRSVVFKTSFCITTKKHHWKTCRESRWKSASVKPTGILSGQILSLRLWFTNQRFRISIHRWHISVDCFTKV